MYKDFSKLAGSSGAGREIESEFAGRPRCIDSFKFFSHVVFSAL